MPGFTNTSLLSLVVAAIERIAPELRGGIPRPDPMHAGVTPDRDKLALLRQCAANHGASSLLEVGQHFDLAEESPVLAVLTRSPDPVVLAQKWMRLESYFHSYHRTEIDLSNANKLVCQRKSSAEPARLEENLLIAGILFGLLQLLGTQSCLLVIEGQAVSARTFRQLSLQGDCAQFSILWSLEKTRSPAETLSTGRINEKLLRLLIGDIGRNWKLDDAARHLAYSPRTLQRHLHQTGRSFTSILRRARMRSAAQLLIETNTPLAEIGYCCGYADQAHFQRDFMRVNNMTPRAFRTVSKQYGAIVQ